MYRPRVAKSFDLSQVKSRVAKEGHNTMPLSKEDGAASEHSMLSNQTAPGIKVDTTGFISPEYFDNEDGADVGKGKPPESRTHLKA